jgi:hypothetical protein
MHLILINQIFLYTLKITLISYCDIVKQIDSEYDVLNTKIRNVKCLTRTINDSIQFIEKIKYCRFHIFFQNFTKKFKKINK